MKNENLDRFKSDYYRMTGMHYQGTLQDRISIMLRHHLCYMWWYRIQERPILGKVAKYKLFRYARKYGLEIRAKSIGRGLYLGHPYNITVGKEVVLGDYCSLHKGCTIGAENRGKRKGSPILGRRVYVGINATIVGNIQVGDDVLIAPNSYVNMDIPSHSIVIGNPAVVKYKENSTEGYINFCDE